MKDKKEKIDAAQETDTKGNILDLIDSEEIISSVEKMLGHELKDKTIVEDILKKNTSMEDYLRILENVKK